MRDAGLEDDDVRESARYKAARIVSLLADGEHRAVANLAGGARWSARRLEATVRDLPIHLVDVPVDRIGEIEVEQPTDGVRTRKLAVVVPLWTVQGKSRWVLELTLHETSAGFLEAQVNGFRRRRSEIPKTPEQVANDRRSAAMNPQSGPVWEERLAEALGRVPPDAEGRAQDAGDVVAQLQRCLDDVQAQLERKHMSLSDVRALTVRTTDLPAARARAEVLALWQRAHGAWEQTTFEPVAALAPPGAVVEVDVRARHAELVAGEAPEPTLNRPVPEHLRPALRAELDALVRGERPEHMLWVDEYGDDGATLVVQPEAIWDHPGTDATLQDDGSWWVILPLWTELECPSDLSAEVEVDPSGQVTLRDLHVM